MATDMQDKPLGDEQNESLSAETIVEKTEDEQELEQYGVWVKAGPEDVEEPAASEELELESLESKSLGDDALLTEEEEELLGDLESFDEQELPSLEETSEDLTDELLDDISLEEPGAVDESPELALGPSDSLESLDSFDETFSENDLDIDLSDISLDEDLTDIGLDEDLGDVGDLGDLEVQDDIVDDLGKDEVVIEDSTSDTLPGAAEDLHGLEIEDIGIDETEDLAELEIEGEDWEEQVEEPVDDLASLEMDLKADDIMTEPSDAVLQKIEAELLSIKEELAGLKAELSSLRQTPSVISEDNAELEQDASGFFAEDEDETIALTGDELDNILNTADITEETVEGTEVLDDQDLLDVPAVDVPDEIIDVPELTPEAIDSPDDDLMEISDISLEDDLLEMPEAEISLEDDLLGTPGDEMLVDKDDIIALEEEPVEELDIEEDALDLSDSEVESGNIELVLDDDLDSSLELLDEDSPELDLDDSLIEDLDTEEIVLDEGPTEELLLEDMDVSEPVIDDLVLEEVSGDDTSAELAIDEIDLDETISTPDADLEELDAEELVSEDLEADSSEDLELESLEEISEEPLEELVEELPGLVEEQELETVEDFDEMTLEEVEAEPADLESAISARSDIPDDLKTELKSVLGYMDQLLESLPEDKIQEFAQSEHFEVYKKLFEELGLET